jgi:hypothetical protein
MERRIVWLIIPGLAFGILAWLWLAGPAMTQEFGSNRRIEQGTVEGRVVDLSGDPVGGTVVRQQTTGNATTSELDGSFELGGLPDGITVTITGWHEGYLVGGARVVAPQTGVVITLTAHYTTDNPDYQWFSSSDPNNPGMSCMHCMVAHAQWKVNAHGTSATNPRFFSVYNGTHLSATGTITPGFKLDFPDEAGNCAACHAPAAAIEGITTPVSIPATITGTFTADMNELSGVETEGSFCEFCHKIGEVYLDPETGLPYDNAPGVFSMRLYRSPPGKVLWFGPLDDVWRRVTFLRLEKKSQFCAPCHQFSFHGTPIYQSFREWLESPYPAQGIECQTCHMKPTGIAYFAFPEKGGLIRDPATLASHLQPGASDVPLLQNTVSMTVATAQVMDRLLVTVTITNTNAGHHVPTDHPGRHMILVVTATAESGLPLPLWSGPTVPSWGGAQSGLPGKAYAKVLRDSATGEMPVVSYWNPTTVASDNRIAAMDSDTSAYTFHAPAAGGPLTVTAELRFRRLYQGLMESKGWPTSDIVMEEEQITRSANQWWGVFLPLVKKEG